MIIRFTQIENLEKRDSLFQKQKIYHLWAKYFLKIIRVLNLMLKRILIIQKITNLSKMYIITANPLYSFALLQINSNPQLKENLGLENDTNSESTHDAAVGLFTLPNLRSLTLDDVEFDDSFYRGMVTASSAKQSQVNILGFIHTCCIEIFIVAIFYIIMIDGGYMSFGGWGLGSILRWQENILSGSCQLNEQKWSLCFLPDG